MRELLDTSNELQDEDSFANISVLAKLGQYVIAIFFYIIELTKVTTVQISYA